MVPPVAPDLDGAADLQVSLNFETLVAGTRVLFDGVAAPLRSVSEKKVSAIVPFAVVPGGVTQVERRSEPHRSERSHGTARVRLPAEPPGLSRSARLPT